MTTTGRRAILPALALAASGGLALFEFRRSGGPAGLLAQAYTVARPFPYRIPDAGWRSVGQTRSDRSGNVLPLLDAEAALSRKHGGSHGELVARARLLRLQTEDAILLLETLRAKGGATVDGLSDLGTAYALRASAQDRPEDLRRALELFSEATAEQPNNARYRFNRALVFEALGDLPSAVEDWKWSANLDPDARWSRESLDKVRDLQGQIEVHQRMRASPDIETRVDLAITDWLPKCEAGNTPPALKDLASEMVRLHRDRWLTELLKEPLDRHARAALSNIRRANLAGNSEIALGSAEEALALLDQHATPAASARCRFELAYAANRTLDSATALAHATRLSKSSYPWLRGQAFLELSVAAKRMGRVGIARQALTDGAEDPMVMSYPDLAMRLRSFRIEDSVRSSGNQLAAWRQVPGLLREYWSGAYPSNRAHQLLSSLSFSAEAAGQTRAAYLLEKSAVNFLAETPLRMLEAVNRDHAGALANRAGLLGEAEDQFKRADLLYKALPDSEVKLRYQTESQLKRARALAESSRPSEALILLESLDLRRLKTNQMLANWRLTKALALIRTGQVTPGNTLLNEVVGSLGEIGAGLPSPQQTAFLSEYRWALNHVLESRIAESAMRGFAFWQAIRRGDLRRQELSLPKEGGSPILSFARLDRGYYVWTHGRLGLRGGWVDASPVEIDRRAESLAKACSTPETPISSIHDDAAWLYSALVKPLENQLEDPASGQRLLIQASGKLSLVPWSVLGAEGKEPLGVIRRLTRLRALRSGMPGTVTDAALPASTRALIVAAPVLPDQLTEAFPPLQSALDEGRWLSRRFVGASTLVGSRATLLAFQRHSIAAELFHFAGHGFVNASNGGILLSGGESLAPSSNALRQCRLAVLSACSTGVGEASEATNPESLVYRFLEAGAARVVASGWRVNSETAFAWMRAFYTALEGAPAGEAARRARAAIATARATRHPYYWAAFDVHE